MTRREARETVFALLYEYDFNRADDPASVYANAVTVRGIEENEYIRSTYAGVCDKREEIDAKIEAAAKNWRVQRMSACTRTILRLAVYEMLFVDDIPVATAMDEAVELAKKYDDENAYAFVNGILSGIKDSEAAGRV